MTEVLVEDSAASRRRTRIVKWTSRLLLAVAVYGLVVLAARLLHRRVLYQPPADRPASGELPSDATLLTTTAADGVTVHALAMTPVSPPAQRTVVHFHGNAQVADDNLVLARDLRRRGLDVVLVEYRGYGRSRAAGAPNEQGLYADAEAVLAELAAHGVGPDRVVLWGHSLGTGVAAEMAKRGRGSRLVLVAPFTSTVDLGSRAAPLLPASLVMVDRFDTLAKAPSIAMPAIVAHGTDDDVIPLEEGKQVVAALPHATFVEVPGGHHDDLYEHLTTLTALTSFASAK